MDQAAIILLKLDFTKRRITCLLQNLLHYLTLHIIAIQMMEYRATNLQAQTVISKVDICVQLT
jgi:hypothetical protein